MTQFAGFPSVFGHPYWPFGEAAHSLASCTVEHAQRDVKLFSFFVFFFQMPGFERHIAAMPIPKKKTS